MLKTADFKTCAQIQPKRGWCFVRKLFLCVFFCLFPIFSFATTLPSGYTELEYIESTGTQYIDTGIYPDKNTEIEMVVKTNGPGSQYLFGVSNKRYMPTQTRANDCLDFYFDGLHIVSSVVGYTDFHKVEIKNQSFIVDGTTFGSFASENNFTQTNTAYIFDAHNHDWVSDTGAKIKYLKIWQSGTLVRDYIPAEHNGQTGMYDAVSGNFFTNAETHYTQLEYLTSTAAQQYIEDNSFDLITTGAIEIKTKNLAPLCRFAGWGNKTNSGVMDIGIATPNSATDYFPYYYNGWVNPSGSSAVNIANENKVRLDFEPGKQKLYINDNLNRQTTNSVTTNHNLPFGLFRISSSGYNSNSTIYYCKVFDENNGLRRHYIPVRRNSDGAIGMYETTTRAFLTNAGTGSFTVGPDTNLFVNEFIAGPEVVEETYTELEYIDIDSDYIDTELYLHTDQSTNYYPNIHYTIMPLRRGTTTADGYLGARTPGVEAGKGVLLGSNASISFVDYFDGDRYSGGEGTNVQLNTKYTLDIVNKVMTLKEATNNTTLLSHTFGDSTRSITKSLTLNALNVSGTGDLLIYDDKLRIYDFEVEGMSHMIPAKRDSDNAIGMYDTVRNKFCTVAGSGTITAGPAVAQPATVEIIWGGLAEPDASGMCTYGETFTAPSTAPTAPSGLKFLGWRPIGQ